MATASLSFARLRLLHTDGPYDSASAGLADDGNELADGSPLTLPQGEHGLA